MEVECAVVVIVVGVGGFEVCSFQGSRCTFCGL